MNTIKVRRELAQETALSYYDGDASALIADEEAAAYSDEKVWATYINVMSDAISRVRMIHLKANGGEWS